jgi:acetylcholinesterase
VAAPQYLTSSSAEIAIMANFTPSLIPIIGKQLLKYDVQRLLQLYPNDPVVGSPFGTGNQTFGLNQAYKQVAALGK